MRMAWHRGDAWEFRFCEARGPFFLFHLSALEAVNSGDATSPTR
jgi:hypothetical protein